MLSAATASPSSLARHRATAACSPCGQHRTVSSGGHWLQLDAPTDVVEAIRTVVDVAQRDRPAEPEVNEHAAPQTQTPASAAGDVTWDFETGDLRGWTPVGTTFAFQPTRGDSPQSRQSASNHQGEYWIGTYERYQGRRGETVGAIQGDRPQRTLESQAFEIPPGPLSFLIGGGSEFATRVELVVISEIDGENRVLHATGNDSDTMRRVTWDLTPFAGRRGRIRVVAACWRIVASSSRRAIPGHEASGRGPVGPPQSRPGQTARASQAARQRRVVRASTSRLRSPYIVACVDLTILFTTVLFQSPAGMTRRRP